MEYYLPFCAGAPASHLAQLDTMETKAFAIMGISHDEAESLGLSQGSDQGETSHTYCARFGNISLLILIYYGGGYRRLCLQRMLVSLVLHPYSFYV